jgi:hypothetical protein
VFDDYCTQVVAGVREDLDGPDDEAYARLAGTWPGQEPCADLGVRSVSRSFGREPLVR